MVDIRIREWSKLRYFDPRRTLIDLRKIETRICGLPMNDKIWKLRTRKLRKYGEWCQAGLLCYGMSEILGTTDYFAPHESAGYDHITRRIVADVMKFTPLQLKELVPADINPEATLDQILADLAKYPTSEDTIVAIYINRRQTMDLKALARPVLRLGELWLYWAASEDQSLWRLHGDLLKDHLDEFRYAS